MPGFIRNIHREEKGIALPIVLALFALGSLILVPSLRYAGTGLKNTQVIARETKGTYAADAGIEYASWEIAKNGGNNLPTQLPENLNNLHVGLQISPMNGGQPYTLYLGNFVLTSGHYTYFSVDGNIVWNAGANAYKYTITVTNNHGESVKIDQIGARLPGGYVYKPNSANQFSGNLSRAEPNIIQNTDGYLVNWGSPTNPLGFQFHNQNDSITQSFYITDSGTGDPIQGEYTWVVIRSQDVNVVGEIIGSLFNITATATDPASGAEVQKVVSHVMVLANGPQIIDWKAIK